MPRCVYTLELEPRTFTDTGRWETATLVDVVVRGETNGNVPVARFVDTLFRGLADKKTVARVNLWGSGQESLVYDEDKHTLTLYYPVTRGQEAERLRLIAKGSEERNPFAILL